MSKFYNKLNCNFTQISNSILLNSNISGTAFKLYSYIVYRLSTNSEWVLYETEIKKHFQEGDKRFKTAKTELIQEGYIKQLKQTRRSDGTMGAFEYEVYSEPQSLCGGAVDGQAETGGLNNNRTNQKLEVINNKEKNIKKENFQTSRDYYKPLEINNSSSSEIPTDSTCKDSLQVEIVSKKNIKTGEIKKAEDILKFFNNQCSLEVDENLERINEDFDENELIELTNFCILRKEEYKSKINNSMQGLKIQYNKAKKIKEVLERASIGFLSIFRKEEENYLYLMTSGGKIVQGLDDWIVDKLLKEYGKQRNQKEIAKPVKIQTRFNN